MKKIAIIPARGGSKRIPRKNIKLFLGKPILAYAIEAALSSKEYGEVMVSTDDEEIADIAISLGAKVPFIRSSGNSNDHATTVDVLLEVLEYYSKQGQEFEIGTCIYPTAPFCTKELLNLSIEKLKQEQRDTVFPVVRYGHPIQRALQFSEEGSLRMIDDSNIFIRSQDLEPSFHDAGQFYTFNVKRLITQKNLMTNNTGAIEVSELKVQDIDNEVDWKLAELKYGL